MRAYIRRRRSFDPARVVAAGDSAWFLEDLFIASGRNLAVAAGFLPSSLRCEARVAFLICRALDAFEDLSADAQSARQGIGAVVSYIGGTLGEPPSTAGLVPAHESEVVDASIAKRLPLLRDEFRKLPVAGQERIRALVADTAKAMLDALNREAVGNHRSMLEYGELVLGRAAQYALQLTGLRGSWEIDFGSIGRVAQAANLLRDADKDSQSSRSTMRREPTEARLRAILEALEASPAIPSTLAALAPAPNISGARAAVTYMIATTAAFYVRRFGHAPPRWLSFPLLLAICALFSHRMFLALCRRLDDLILNLVMYADIGCESAASGSSSAFGEHTIGPRSRLKQSFENWLAMQHPEAGRALALHRVCRVAHVVMVTCDVFPAQTIVERQPSPQTKNAVMILDYLLACAIRDVSSFGNRVLEEFSELVARLAVRAEAGAGNRDRDCEIARFLATVVGRARGLTGDRLVHWTNEQRIWAQYLHRVDHEGGRLQRRRAAAKLAVLRSARSSTPFSPEAGFALLSSSPAE